MGSGGPGFEFDPLVGLTISVLPWIVGFALIASLVIHWIEEEVELHKWRKEQRD